MAHEDKTIPVGKLLLDTENPRHEQVDSQRDAIHALIERERQKLVVLADDIKEHGLSPIDRLLVIRKGSSQNFIVVEGNRRLAAVKLLANPDLAKGTVIEAQMKRIAKDANVPTAAECALVDSRDDAEHWMILRHRGQMDGAGVVPWNSYAANRFSHKPGTQAYKAVEFLEAVSDGYPDNEVIQDLSRAVADKRLTTLGRLVQDPDFRSRIGMVPEDHVITFEYPPEELQAFLEHVLGDLASDVGVSQLKNKDQRSKYLKGTPKPDPKKKLPDPKPLGEAPSSKPSPKPKPKPKPKKPAKPFRDLDLSNLESKTQALLKEFRGLDENKLPNATGILVRVIVEFVLDEFIQKKNLKHDKELRKRLGTCLHHLDPNRKDDRFKWLRQGLSDGTSLFAVSTLNAYVHNPHFQADGNTVRAIAANVEPFLQQLNDLA